MSGSHKMCVQHQNLAFCFTIMKNEQIIQVFCYQVIVFIPIKCLIQLFTAYEILSMRKTSFSCLCGMYHFVTVDIFLLISQKLLYCQLILLLQNVTMYYTYNSLKNCI